jgi:hypothetical protein
MSFRTALAVAVLALPFAGPLQAQPANEIASPPVAAATSHPVTDGQTVSGVTVTPTRPAKPCGSRDKGCVALVIAKLKAQYPQELKAYCLRERIHVQASAMNAQDMGMCRFGGSSSCEGYLAPALKLACEGDTHLGKDPAPATDAKDAPKP